MIKKNMDNNQIYKAAAYGGPDWKPRSTTHQEEIGGLWNRCGINSEWRRLRSVILHKPGNELSGISDPNAYQMLDKLDVDLARDQHDAIAKAFSQSGVEVHYVDPLEKPSPNLMFCADLLFMTPSGVILARPASEVRAGEEVNVAKRLGTMNIPILKIMHSSATFEGADALWINERKVFIGRGLRTNQEAITQITTTLEELGVRVTPIDLPIGTMHLMGVLRFLDRDLAICWPYRLAWKAVEELELSGIKILFIPDEEESIHGGALNFVTLGPKKILLAEGNPITQGFLESKGVECNTVRVDELHKAAGGIGCLTGIIERDLRDYEDTSN
jgi:N-dimethylarginine dimethylaminohydrolase